MTATTLVHSAQQLVRIDADGFDTVENGAVAIEDGTIVGVGPTAEVSREYPIETADVEVDASGRTVLPGYVDPHTHAVFAGERVDEFTAKLHGTSYQEIQADGGGILSTVRAVRESSLAELTDHLLTHLNVMLAHGTTTAEVKSGYGLSLESERRLLEAIERANDRHPIDLVPTFLGAHAVPEGQDADSYVDRVITEQLPAIASDDLATFCDVFCDEGAFTREQSRRVLEAGLEYGLTPKIHAEEFARLGGAQLAADLGAVSADHLLQATSADAAAMADAGVTPVFLPGTAFTLDTEYADPSLFDAVGLPVALASDFNPNCYSQSMEFAMALACHGMRMTPEETLSGATRHAAAALALEDGTGTIAPGAPGDLVVADVPRFEYVPYNFGVQTTDTVLKGGEVVYDD